MSDILVFGSLNADFFVTVANLPAPGETTMGENTTVSSGGKGGNQAHAAAKLADPDIRVSMVALVGDDDAGATLRADLIAAGVNVDHVQSIDGHASGMAFITVERSGINTIVVSPGANEQWTEAFVDAIPIVSGDVVVLQLEIPVPTVASIVRRARAAGARTVLNAAPVDVAVTSILPDIDVLVVNEIEAAQLLGLYDLSEDAVESAARDLPYDLIVTRGGDGLLLAPRDGGFVAIPAFTIEAIDTVGAGDAFVGGFAASLARGESLESAAQTGSAAGAATATIRGARHLSLSQQHIDALTGRS